MVGQLGAEAVQFGHKCSGVDQDDDEVTLQFEGEQRRAISPLPAMSSTQLSAHSFIRTKACHNSAVSTCGGASPASVSDRGRVNRVGTVQRGKMVIYAIRQFEDGTQLINWNTEQPRDDHKPNDWVTPGRIEDFIEPFQDWKFDWLDIPQLFADAEFIMEYPMVDRDPVDRWVWDRIALMGDAAHPMYPRVAMAVHRRSLMQSAYRNCWRMRKTPGGAANSKTSDWIT